MFKPLDHPACLSSPLLLEESAWAEHIPFAMFAVSAAKPGTIVELGVWRGVSYCAFCQAVSEIGLGTKCCGIDTWEGDQHAGDLSEEALSALREHHDPLYSRFSRLIRSAFDDALGQFPDGTIDLLHIDGLHTYESVRHDFVSWLPKMSRCGVVMFHDTEVRERDFGVYRLWEELSVKYPSFNFPHGHGLGVLAVGKEIPGGLKFLFDAEVVEADLIRRFFKTLGAGIEAMRELREQQRINRHQEHVIEQLKPYERFITGSRILRAGKAISSEGVRGLVRRHRKKL